MQFVVQISVIFLIYLPVMTLTSGGVFDDPYRHAVQLDNPVAWWRLDDDYVDDTRIACLSCNGGPGQTCQSAPLCDGFRFVGCTSDVSGIPASGRLRVNPKAGLASSAGTAAEFVGLCSTTVPNPFYAVAPSISKRAVNHRNAFTLEIWLKPSVPQVPPSLSDTHAVLSAGDFPTCDASDLPRPRDGGALCPAKLGAGSNAASANAWGHELLLLAESRILVARVAACPAPPPPGPAAAAAARAAVAGAGAVRRPCVAAQLFSRRSLPAGSWTHVALVYDGRRDDHVYDHNR
jgi:hypothetical protein